MRNDKLSKMNISSFLSTLPIYRDAFTPQFKILRTASGVHRPSRVLLLSVSLPVKGYVPAGYGTRYRYCTGTRSLFKL